MDSMTLGLSIAVITGVLVVILMIYTLTKPISPTNNNGSTGDENKNVCAGSAYFNLGTLDGTDSEKIDIITKLDALCTANPTTCDKIVSGTTSVTTVVDSDANTSTTAQVSVAFACLKAGTTVDTPPATAAYQTAVVFCLAHPSETNYDNPNPDNLATHYTAVQQPIETSVGFDAVVAIANGLYQDHADNMTDAATTMQCVVDSAATFPPMSTDSPPMQVTSATVAAKISLTPTVAGIAII
jgi:hypothetical protein